MQRAPGAEVFLKDTELTVQADQEDLRDVLQAIAEFGVHVEMDPQIQQTVTMNARGADVEETIAELVRPLGYALVWTVTNNTSRLDALRVFRIGRELEARPLIINRNLNVVQSWNGKDHFVADELLITVAPGTTLEAFQTLLAQLGATIIEAHPGLGIYRLRFPPGTNIEALITQLARNELIRHAEPNYAYRMPSGEYAPLTSAAAPTALRRVNAPASSGNALAILDSGLTLLPELQPSLIGAYDSFDPESDISDPAGHGTQMALIASGAIVPDGGLPSAEGIPLIAIRAFDSNGYTSTAELLRAVDYALNGGARVINMSWGTETDSEFLRRIAAYAQARGALVVASAGNEPTGKPVYPAACPGVLSVGAVNPDGSSWEKSNYGDFVDLAAPGSAVFPVGYNGPAGAYMGTSAAAAYTSRAIASYFTRHPDADPQQALNALAEAVTDAGEPGRDTRYGVGVLDAQATQRFLQ